MRKTWASGPALDGHFAMPAARRLSEWFQQTDQIAASAIYP